MTLPDVIADAAGPATGVDAGTVASVAILARLHRCGEANRSQDQ
jgi:hypothetical protein